MLEKLTADPEWYDTKMAGYWIWSASCRIGPDLTSINGIPHVDNGGMGVHKISKRPHVSSGMHKISKRPHIYNVNIQQWFRDLSERLRYVRVVCGVSYAAIGRGCVAETGNPPWASAEYFLIRHMA